eukprot:14898878-Ditylum_brightwellii.AAC.1
MLELFCEHFNKIFSNQSPPPCDLSALDLIKQHKNVTLLNELPTLNEVKAAHYQVANDKVAGPSGIISDALKTMVWIKRISDNRRIPMMQTTWSLPLMPCSWTSGPKQQTLNIGKLAFCHQSSKG